MVFTSLQFFIFLPAVLLLYFMIPRKWRAAWLLLASYAFYMNFNPKYVVVILFSTIVSYIIGLQMEKAGDDRQKKKKYLVTAGVLITLGVLCIFKYTNFVLQNVNSVLNISSQESVHLPFTLILPVGISYFSFQIISYLVDVYKEKIHAEKNLLYYALYISFFPKIISGPIERADNFLTQIHDCAEFKLWNSERIRNGLILIIWGYFQKLVIADRLAIFVTPVFTEYWLYGTTELFLGMILFMVQLYADFSGYMSIAMGVSKIMGFSLRENFNAPLFAKSIGDFWARWHITLSSWLKDYIYIPLGGNRKGRTRQYVNLFVTFLASGLWHGASWGFIIWGGMNGVYMIFEKIIQPVVDKWNQKLHTKTESFGYKSLQIIRTYFMTVFAVIFFKADTLREAVGYIHRMFTRWNPWVCFDGSLYTIGINQKTFQVLSIAIIVFFLVDVLKEKKKKNLDIWLSEQCIWFRGAAILFLLIFTIVFGVYGPAYDAGNFIYFQF